MIIISEKNTYVEIKDSQCIASFRQQHKDNLCDYETVSIQTPFGWIPIQTTKNKASGSK